MKPGNASGEETRIRVEAHKVLMPLGGSREHSWSSHSWGVRQWGCGSTSHSSYWLRAASRSLSSKHTGSPWERAKSEVVHVVGKKKFLGHRHSGLPSSSEGQGYGWGIDHGAAYGSWTCSASHWPGDKTTLHEASPSPSLTSVLFVLPNQCLDHGWHLGVWTKLLNK